MTQARLDPDRQPAADERTDNRREQISLDRASHAIRALEASLLNISIFT
jgi:hypothetical protein